MHRWLRLRLATVFCDSLLRFLMILALHRWDGMGCWVEVGVRGPCGVVLVCLGRRLVSLAEHGWEMRTLAGAREDYSSLVKRICQITGLNCYLQWRCKEGNDEGYCTTSG